MRIPYMKPCPECAKSDPEVGATPSIELDTNTGKYTCANNHDLPADVIGEEYSAKSAVTGLMEEAGIVEAPPVPEVEAALADHREALNTATGVSTVPEPFAVTTKPITVPDSLEKVLTAVDYELPLAGGDVVIGLRVPEAYVGSIREYAQSQGKTLMEFVNERVAFGMEQGWFV